MPPLAQFSRQASRRLTAPPQQAHGVPCGIVLHKVLQVPHQRPIPTLHRHPSTPRLAHPLPTAQPLGASQLSHPFDDRGAGHPRQRLGLLKPSPSPLDRLLCDRPPCPGLIEGCQHFQPQFLLFVVSHATTLPHSYRTVKSIFRRPLSLLPCGPSGDVKAEHEPWRPYPCLLTEKERTQTRLLLVLRQASTPASLSDW